MSFKSIAECWYKKNVEFTILPTQFVGFNVGVPTFECFSAIGNAMEIECSAGVSWACSAASDEEDLPFFFETNKLFRVFVIAEAELLSNFPF